MRENRLIGYTKEQIDSAVKPKKPAAKPVTPQPVKTPPLSTKAPVLSSSVDPNRGTRGEGRPAGPVTLESAQQFGKTIEEQRATVQAMADDEYLRTGSVSPETTAYMERLDPNKQAYFNQTSPVDPQAARDAQLASARDLTKTPIAAPTAAPTSKTQLPAGTMEDRVTQRRNVRLAENGVPQESFAEIDAIMKAGGKVVEEVNGMPVFLMPDGSKRTPTTANASTTKSAIDIAGTDFTSEVQQEQDQTVMQQKQDARTQTEQDRKNTTAPTYDPAPFQQTATQLQELMGMMKGLDPDSQAALLPQLLQLQNTNAEIQKQVNDMTSSYQTDAELAADAAVQNAYILDSDAKYKDLISRNNQTALDVAKFNRDALEIDKRIMDHNAAVSEQKQAAMNVESEKKLRRQLNRLGIQTDVQGLNFLQSEIQKGVDALENLKTANNLVSLKAQLAIGEGYRLEVKQAMETYESNYLNITAQTNERLAAVKNSISTAKADRAKGIIEAKKWGLEQKMKNDEETRTRISDARKEMATRQADLAKAEQERKKDARDTLKWLFETFENPDPAAIDKYAAMLGDDGDWFKSMTLAETKKDGITPYQSFEAQNNLRKEFMGAKVYETNRIIEKSFDQISNAVAESNRISQDIDAGLATEESLLGSDINMMYSFIKMMDDTSAVREGELELLSNGQSWTSYIKGLVGKAEKDGTTLNAQQRESIRRQAEGIQQYVGMKYLEHVENTAAMIEDANLRFGMDINPRSILGADYYPGGADAADAAMDDPNGPKPLSFSNWQRSLGSVTQNPNTSVSYIKGRKEHGGYDIAGKMNAPIPAYLPGKVISVSGSPKDTSGWGLSVVLEDAQGNKHRYAHLNRLDPSVKVGSVIPAGQPFAFMGKSGNVKGKTGIHLHYEIVAPDGSFIDPADTSSVAYSHDHDHS